MRIFISWSGARSKAVAELLCDWIGCVLQVSRPWISARDIDRGALWFNDIAEQLKDTAVAIICLTDENKDRPWILFESGAVMKGLSTSRVCTFLIDLGPADVSGPLSHFNHTTPQRDSVLQLVNTLNKNLGAAALDPRILTQVFDTYWEQFERRFKSAVDNNPPAEPPKPRAESDMLREILQNSRDLSARVTRLEDGGHSNTAKRIAAWITQPPTEPSAAPYEYHTIIHPHVANDFSIPAFMDAAGVVDWKIIEQTADTIHLLMGLNQPPGQEFRDLAQKYKFTVEKLYSILQGHGRG